MTSWGTDLRRLSPGTDADGWWTVLRSGLWRMYYMLSAEGRKRYFNELLPLLHRTKLEVMGSRDAECYYLVYLGTKPRARGRGYARKLIEDMMGVVSPSFALALAESLWLLPLLSQQEVTNSGISETEEQCFKGHLSGWKELRTD